MPVRAARHRDDQEGGNAWQTLAHAVLDMDPAERMVYLSACDPGDLSIIQHAVSMETGKGTRVNPATLAAALDPERWRPQRHIDLLAEKFRQACDGESIRQLWNLPARLQKTSTLARGVAWALDRRDSGRWIYTTYGDDLADEFGITVRDILAEHPDQLRARLRQDVARKDRFLTSGGGGLLCRGFFSAITGFGANRDGGLLVDDPMKNWQEAHSPARRAKVFDNFTGTIRNRLDDEDTPIIVAHTRWHTEDITGQLLDHMQDGTGEEWDLVALPALCVDPLTDLLGRALGEPIAPDIFTREDVQRRHRGLVSSVVVAAIEQQAPVKDAGNELKRDWFTIALQSELPTAPSRAITSWDLKLKDREAGDYVVGQCWWQVGTGYWLMDQIRGQYDHATTANAIALLAVRHPEAQHHVIEAAGSADEVVPQLRRPMAEYVVSDEMFERLGMTDDERDKVQALRRSGLGNLKPETPVGPKPVRARVHIAPQAEYGHVRLAEAGWNAAWLDEVADFPVGLHDDQVDAASQALKFLAQNPGLISTPQRGQRQPGRAGTRLNRPTRRD